MNTLSWMIYFAGVVGTVKVTAALGAFGLTMFMGGNLIASFADVLYREDEDKRPKHLARAKALIPYLAALLAILIVVPSRTTVYAIAASEMGEQALHSTTGGKAIQALNAWLDRQIAGDDAPEAKAK